MIQDFQFFLIKAFIFVLCIEWHSSSCTAAPCYDFLTRESRPCFPQPVNAARRRNVTASNTCGMPSASYCEISPEKKCFICDANSSLNMHPPEYMIDEESPFASQPTWWQSDTWWDAIQSGLSKIAEPLHVNITLTFGKSYHISGKIRVTFYSERPQAMVIERSNDGGITWKVYQYFAEDCVSTYGISPSESPSTENPLEVTCSEEYNGQFPEKNGIVEFQAYTRYSPEDYMAPHIQSYMLATHVRLRLEYPGTDGLELINSEVTLNRYYYAISDVRIDGRCNCHGHAEYCDGVGMNQYCFCEHYTMGRDCEYCRPLYNNDPWKPANTTHANECQKCHCNEHASSCTYDANVGSGVCIDCNHNTTGVQCHECADGFIKTLGNHLTILMFAYANPSISENETSQLPPHLSTASARGTQRHSLSSQVINENGENVGDMRIHVLQNSSTSFEGSRSHDARHSLSSQDINENGDASQHAPEISSIEEKEEDFGEDSTEEDNDTFLEETFLDDEYCIREEVHEKFKRCMYIL